MSQHTDFSIEARTSHWSMRTPLLEVCAHECAQMRALSQRQCAPSTHQKCPKTFLCQENAQKICAFLHLCWRNAQEICAFSQSVNAQTTKWMRKQQLYVRQMHKKYAHAPEPCQPNTQEICAFRLAHCQAESHNGSQNFTSLGSRLTTFCLENSFKARTLEQAKIFGEENPKTKFQHKIFDLGKQIPN